MKSFSFSYKNSIKIKAPQIVIAVLPTFLPQSNALNQKFKDKKFAAKCNRDYILEGCALLGMDVKDFAAICIEGMREHAAEIGLAGHAA